MMTTTMTVDDDDDGGGIQYICERAMNRRTGPRDLECGQRFWLSSGTAAAAADSNCADCCRMGLCKTVLVLSYIRVLVEDFFLYL